MASLQQVHLPQDYSSEIPGTLEESPLFQRLFSSDVDKLELGVENAKLLFESMRCHFEASGSYSTLIEAIALRQVDLCRTKKAIAFGIGNIAGETRMYRNPEQSHEELVEMWRDWVLQSMLQFVFFVCVVDDLSANGEHIEAYAQDPVFTAEDEEFFQSLGIQVVKFPQGESLIDQSTLVYSPHLPANHNVSIPTRCSKHRPGVSIGNWVETSLESMTLLPYLYRHLNEDGKTVMANQLLDFMEQHDDLPICDPESDMEDRAHYETKAYVANVSILGAEDHQCTWSCSHVIEFGGVTELN